jgi:TetR/AcrR family transcriptional regulator, transcriptional repressor for nem operon
MKKGEATRRRIVAQAAGLLNTQGYRSTPVSEIMRVTGLRKGGIYRHFDSRTTLTLEAFEYAVARMRDRFLRAAEGHATATEALLALLGVFREASRDEVFRGGCPIMNLAIESDDADPHLRSAARKAMTQLVGCFEQVIERGVRAGEFPKGDARARARVIVATLEGGLLLGNLYKDRSPLVAVGQHLERYVRNGLQ